VQVGSEVGEAVLVKVIRINKLRRLVRGISNVGFGQEVGVQFVGIEIAHDAYAVAVVEAVIRTHPNGRRSLHFIIAGSHLVEISRAFVSLENPVKGRIATAYPACHIQVQERIPGTGSVVDVAPGREAVLLAIVVGTCISTSVYTLQR